MTKKQPFNYQVFISHVMSLKTNTSQCDWYTELLTAFTVHLSDDLNLARIRLICLFVTALCKVKSVNYSELFAGFDSPSPASSCFRRIQRFMAQVDLPMRLISTLIFNILQNESPVVLIIDRTKPSAAAVEIRTAKYQYTHVGYQL